MVMDMRRTCRVERWFFGDGDDSEASVRWFVAPPNAKVFESETPFRSLDWWDRLTPGAERPGPVKGAVGDYNLGRTPPAYKGQAPCGPKEWWESGVPSPVPPAPPRDGDCVPECCGGFLLGTALMGGTAAPTSAPAVAAGGGIEVDGTAPPAATRTSDGGIEVDGSAPPAATRTSDGGIEVDGLATVVYTPAPAGIARVQTAKNSGTGTTLAATWPANTTAGNILIACLHCVRGNGGNLTATPPSGWTAVITGGVRQGNSGSGRSYQWYRENAAAQGATGNFTVSNSGGVSLVVAEYSGLKTSGAIDAPSVGSNTSASTSSPVVNTTTTTAQASELLVAMHGGNASVTYSAPTNSFSIYNQQAQTDASVDLCDRIMAATINTSCQVTASATINYAGIMGCFKGV